LRVPFLTYEERKPFVLNPSPIIVHLFFSPAKRVKTEKLLRKEKQRYPVYSFLKFHLCM
jgi:hypothetical protein